VQTKELRKAIGVLCLLMYWISITIVERDAYPKLTQEKQPGQERRVES
jgi:hypothetical protein